MELGGRIRLNARIGKIDSRRCHVAAEGETCWKFNGEPQPYSDT